MALKAHTAHYSMWMFTWSSNVFIETGTQQILYSLNVIATNNSFR